MSKDRFVDWIASWLFIAASIAFGVMTFVHAARGDFLSVAVYFYCSLMWFDMHLMNMDCVAMIKRMEAKL